VEGDNTRFKSYLIEMWEVNVHYWKTPNANRKSQHMQTVCAQIRKLVILGQTSLLHFMELHVSSNLDIANCYVKL